MTVPTNRITKNFSIDEFLISETAEALGDANRPTAEHLKNIGRTAVGMEDIRALFNRAIVITSGYRNPRVNAAVGGVPTSAHALGHAVDFHVAGFTDLAAAKIIRDAMPRLPMKIDQLILEKGRCIHVSFDPRARGQVLRQPGGPGSQVFIGLEA